MGRVVRIYPKINYWLLAIWGAALFVLAVPSQAQEVDAYLTAPDSVTVGDRFYLTLVAKHSSQNEAFFPEATAGDSIFGDLVIVERLSAETRYLGAEEPGTRLDSILYEVTTFALDTALVPSIPVHFATQEDTFWIGTPPLMLQVASLVPADAADIQDLAPLVEFPRPIWPWVLLILAVLTVIGLIIYYLRQKQQTPEPEAVPVSNIPLVTPYESAMRRLRKLEHTDRIALEEAKPFFIELSDILRTYLERSLGVPALERTTRELMQEIDVHEVSHKLPGGAPQHVKSILELSDLVKFADMHPPVEQSQSALVETRQTVEGIETKLRQIVAQPPPEEVPPAEPELEDTPA